MVAPLKEHSKITEKGQTTVPRSVRQALGVRGGDHIAYIVDPKRGVSVVRVEAEEEEADPVIDRFLTLLAAGMERDPLRMIAEFPEALATRMADLTRDIHVDLDEAIDGSVSL